MSQLRSAVAEPGFARLYATRLAGQTADGVFQVGLAGYVLFSPERQAGAGEVAAALAVLLVPFSLVGPFAGVLIDRWRRQRILLTTNVLRACAVVGVGLLVAAGVSGPAFYLAALVVISLNRFVLATLSAGLPHVVRPTLLVAANAVSTTSGTIAAVVGAAVGLSVRHLAGASDPGAAVVVWAAAALYLLAALAATTLRPSALGPDERPARAMRVRESVRVTAVGLVAAVRHLRSRPAAEHALGAMVAQRVAFGFMTVTTIVLCRNYFHPSTDVDAGVRTLALVVVATGVGVLVGAIATPAATRRVGLRRWVAACFAVSALVQLAFGLPYTVAMLAVGGTLLGAFAQSVRVCIDSVVQRSVDDLFLGRVFALYDMLFNVAFVASAVLAALVLPPDGRAPLTVVLVATVYLGAAAWWLRATRTDAAFSRAAAAPTTDGARPSPRPR